MEIIHEFRWCKEYNMEYVRVSLNEHDITIWDSYKIKKYKHMKEIIEWIKSFDKKYLFNKPVWYHIAEWRAHNLLHSFEYQQNRTRHTNLDGNQNFTHKIAYIVLSLFYWGF